MQRTPEEEIEYQGLPSSIRERYDYHSNMDPTLTHQAVIKICGFNITIEDIFKRGGQDINPKDPETEKKILEDLAKFVKTRAPSVWRIVKDEFMKAIQYLGELISRGMSWVEDNIIDPAIDFLDSIFG